MGIFISATIRSGFFLHAFHRQFCAYAGAGAGIGDPQSVFLSVVQAQDGVNIVQTEMAPAVFAGVAACGEESFLLLFRDPAARVTDFQHKKAVFQL